MGSIGKRHLRNLLALHYKDICVVTSKPLIEEFYGVEAYNSIEGAFSQTAFDAAFICTPTSNHIDCLIKLLQYKVKNIYVEKPLSHSIINVKEVLQLASSYSNNIKVGFDLHFDPGIQKIRQLLLDEIIGRVISVNAFVGQYLPAWRPYEDHRKGMSAKVETGGGVLLDIIHEFDYLRWLTGKVDSVASWHTNSGTLEIETEEVAEVLLKFKNHAIGTVHLDYLQPKLTRHCIFTGTKGSITANLVTNYVEWSTHEGVKDVFDYTGFERNDKFKAIVHAFLENNTDERLTSLNDAFESQLIVEAAKQSNASNNIVKLSAFS